jgi:hypothetical protein
MFQLEITVLVDELEHGLSTATEVHILCYRSHSSSSFH